MRDVIEHETRDLESNLFGKPKKNVRNDLIAYLTKLSESYKGNTLLTWDKAIKHAKKFFGDSFAIEDLSKPKCREYASYLKNQVSNNSANTYFHKFKQSIKRMVDDELLTTDLAANIVIPTRPSDKQYLTLEEINIIAGLPMRDEHVKNAFLFSCFTGLRFGDLQLLIYNNVKDDRLNIKMQKTKTRLSFQLHPEAINIIERQRVINKGKLSDRVFNLADYEGVRRKWKRFFRTTGIDKKITFHCARHTFGTLCVTTGIDIYTISKLMGHKDVKITQVYLKLMDEKKDEAIMKLPGLG